MSLEQDETRLGRSVEVPVDEARLARTWRGISARAYGPSRRPHAYAGAAVLVAVAVALLGVLVVERGEPAGAGPLATVGVDESRPIEVAVRDASGAGASVSLDDGSVIHVAPGAVIEPLENTGERFSLALRSGRAHFDVRPGGPRRWTIEAGLVTVEVVGTAFEVHRDERAVSVSVERGRVLVRGDGVPDRVRSLGAGESIRVSASALAETVASEREAPAAPDRLAVEALSDDGPATPPSPRSRSATRTEPSASAPVSVAALLEEADSARRAGRIDDALERLARAAERDGDPDAALAGLTRGRLALEQGRAAEASRDLRRALALGLPPALEETARARLVEALARSGDREGARRAADDYARHHPQGAWREAVARALEE